jgi:probable addiction module antidote protein
MTKAEFTKCDSADYLTSLDHVAAYLEAVLEEAGGDPAFFARALGKIARSQNFNKLARHLGIGREGLCKALSSEGQPAPRRSVKVA